MPFTFAHPSTILPMRKKKNYDFTALLVGSMSPDFEYFIHFRPYQVHGHTILGLFYYNLPLVLIVSIIWHYILKEQLIKNLPKPYCTYYFYLTINKWKITSIKSFVIFIYSALIGMITHLLWDGFTHANGYFVSKISILSHNINLLSFEIPIYKMLQHGSSVIGLTILIIYLRGVQQKNLVNEIFNINKFSKCIYWISIAVLDFTLVALVNILKEDFRIGSIITGIISAGFISAIIVSILVNNRHLT